MIERPPLDHADERQHRGLLAQAIRALFDGKSNNTGSVTLTANQATTVVSDRRVGTASVILLMPKTANAAAAIGTTYISARGKQTFTITHANAATTDRSFEYAIIG